MVTNELTDLGILNLVWGYIINMHQFLYEVLRLCPTKFVCVCVYI
jgi:hypothetical protein